MIRPIEPRDIPRLKELQGEFEWTFGRDFMCGLVKVDSEDQPVMFAGAWSLAEVHMVSSAWNTPGARFAALQEIHAAMEKQLRGLGVGQAVTWMDKISAFTRRLGRLGWINSKKTSWHRGIR